MNLADIMTTELVTCHPNETLSQVALKMHSEDIRCCPVVERDRLVGMVSLADLAIDLEEDEILAETLVRISEPSR
ncbi:MAG: hypothetical protein A2Z18_07915 [Armatimonadetes bacterium RBG_16_58_9]|nr:MAG: hypothetical protein A2Z18_07915 [Armatimonadetes bacterium RBG_16_58_9]